MEGNLSVDQKPIRVAVIGTGSMGRGDLGQLVIGPGVEGLVPGGSIERVVGLIVLLPSRFSASV